MPLARLHFEEEMNRLHHDILTMGTRVEEDLRKAIDSLKRRDEELAREVKADDAVINAMQIKIEDQTAMLMATQAPVARDLRELVTILKTVNDLERIGDYGVHLAKMVIKLKGEPELPQFESLANMAETGCLMIRDSIKSLLERSESLARQTAEKDTIIDELHHSLVKETLEYMKANPEKVTQASKIIATSGFLERLGDHVRNICESVIYMVEGTHVELNE